VISRITSLLANKTQQFRPGCNCCARKSCQELGKPYSNAGTYTSGTSAVTGSRYDDDFEDHRTGRAPQSFPVTCSSTRHVSGRFVVGSDTVRSPLTTMHNFRLRWVALGLLMYVQGAICRNSPLCLAADGERFDDVPSRTVGARAVVEAIAQQVRPVYDVPGRSYIKFRVKQIHKLDNTLPPFLFGVASEGTSNTTKSRRTRTTNSSSSASSPSFSSEIFCEAVFGGATARESKKKALSSAINCSTEQTDKVEVKRRASYLIFIGHNGRDELANNSDYVICKSRLNGSQERLSLSGFPLRVTKSASNEVKRFASCSKCRKYTR